MGWSDNCQSLRKNALEKSVFTFTFHLMLRIFRDNKVQPYVCNKVVRKVANVPLTILSRKMKECLWPSHNTDANRQIMLNKKRLCLPQLPKLAVLAAQG